MGTAMTIATVAKREKEKKKATVENIAYSISMIVEIRPNRITINISNWTC